MAVLYVVATPIGNLQDLSPRGIETLKTADLILAEDTRVTLKLCNVFGFRTKMESCHRHNEQGKAQAVAEHILQENLTAALVTDAGTPCISDPGNEIVRACIECRIPVIPIPGCCAGIAALSVSGFDAKEFSFYGFPPREKKALREKLLEIASGCSVAILHESPFRIAELTEAVCETLPDAEMTVCCDLTKLHEKTVYGSPRDVLEQLKSNDKTEKGEYCVVLNLRNVPKKPPVQTGKEISLEALLIEEMKRGKTLREAQSSLLAEGKNKNAVKQAAITLKNWFAQM